MSDHQSQNFKWHMLSVEDVLQHLKSDPNGLHDKEVRERLLKYGKNELISEKKASLLELFLTQFKSFLVIILIIASVISFLLGKNFEAISIFTIVVLAAVLGTIQEFQAGRAMDALKKMAAPTARVIRNGLISEIPAVELVPGDIVLINYGDKIPADIRLIEVNNLQIEESALTGESSPADKNLLLSNNPDCLPADRKNMVFMGTVVLLGRGKGVVVDTGLRTEFGKIATMLKDMRQEITPLQRTLDKVGKNLGIFALAVALLLSVFSFIHIKDIAEVFIWAVALAVAIIPEALPAVVTISLAIGVKKMVGRRALVRKLPAVETLGAVNYICSDKTGTLTKDEMTIKRIYTNGNIYDFEGSGYEPTGRILYKNEPFDISEHPYLLKSLQYGILCNSSNLAQTPEGWRVQGDPTEGAIIVAGLKAGLHKDEIDRTYQFMDEIPFSSERKYMVTFHRDPESGKILMVTKGAFEYVLPMCENIILRDKITGIDSAITESLNQIVDGFASNAFRIIAVAYTLLDENDGEIKKEKYDNLTFCGLYAMIDPPRMEVKDAIKTCVNAGIKTIMITGDNKKTAFAIAKELNIASSLEDETITGEELEKMSLEELDEKVEHKRVFARISPFHKLKIVEALMRKGHIVAMTGDGVNDAPALKKANIGVAMGITGTDVSKEASDMILTDDNFVSIVSAVEEGRSIFENIKKYLVFLLSGNAGTVLAIIFAFIFFPNLEREFLTAVQILFINFIMDGLMAIALSMEPAEAGIMNRHPRNVKQGVFSRNVITRIMSLGFFISILTFGAYVIGIHFLSMNDTQATTLAYLTLIFARLFNGYSNRSLKNPFYKSNLFSNYPLLISAAICVLLAWFTTSIGFLQKAFDNSNLDYKYWLIAIAAGILLLPFGDLMKKIRGDGEL